MRFKEFVMDSSGDPQAGIGMAIRGDRIGDIRLLLAKIKRNIVGTNTSLASADANMAKRLSDSLKDFESALQDCSDELSH